MPACASFRDQIYGNRCLRVLGFGRNYGRDRIDYWWSRLVCCKFLLFDKLLSYNAYCYRSCIDRLTGTHLTINYLFISRSATLSYAVMSRQAKSGALTSRMSTRSSLPCVPWKTASMIASALVTVTLASFTMEIQPWSVRRTKVTWRYKYEIRIDQVVIRFRFHVHLASNFHMWLKSFWSSMLSLPYIIHIHTYICTPSRLSYPVSVY